MPPTPRTERYPRDQNGILRVAPELWSEFAVYESPTEPGWIALPPVSESVTYHSPVNPAAQGWLAPAECQECHPQHVEGCLDTAHFRTCQIPTPASVLGPLTGPANRLETRVPDFVFETLLVQDQVVQKLMYPSPLQPQVLTVPLAFVMGSGNHGQSYLAWHGDMLCQTPVSYLSEANRWSNSPGTYQDGTADFSRPATQRCLDCHNTWFGHAPGSLNRYDKATWILGVTCVRCHGPATDHVKYHRQFPDQTAARYIVNPRSLSRERANEVCGQCHSGAGEPKRPAFTYRPGERLQDWIAISLEASDSGNDDPHSANQLGRLMRSRCYIESGTLTCMDCHDLHQQERGQQELFSSRCQHCHQLRDCGLSGKFGSQLSAHCIECHMPSRRDAEVTSQGAKSDFLPLLRDHQIGIWPDVSQLVEQQLQAE